jgi:hypothetical protein
MSVDAKAKLHMYRFVTGNTTINNVQYSLNINSKWENGISNMIAPASNFKSNSVPSSISCDGLTIPTYYPPCDNDMRQMLMFGYWDTMNIVFSLKNITTGGTLALYFSENYFFAAGKRIFDIMVNGDIKFSNFDTFVAAGNKHGYAVALYILIPVAPVNNTITVTYLKKVENPHFYGFAFIPASPSFIFNKCPAGSFCQHLSIPVLPTNRTVFQLEGVLTEAWEFFYLDRFVQACGTTSALNQFKFQASSATQAKYSYKCISLDNNFIEATRINDYTSLVEENPGGGSYLTSQLQYHNLDCTPYNGVITKFLYVRLQKVSPTKGQYAFVCISSVNPLICRTLTTSETTYASSIYTSLILHDVKCDSNEFISKFQYKYTSSTNKIYYTYVCCSVQSVAPLPNVISHTIKSCGKGEYCGMYLYLRLFVSMNNVNFFSYRRRLYITFNLQNWVLL